MWHFSRFDASLPDTQCLKWCKILRKRSTSDHAPCCWWGAVMQFYHMLLWSTMVCTCACHVLFSACHPETYSGLISLKWWQLLMAKASGLKIFSILHSSCSEWMWHDGVCSNKIWCAEVVKAVNTDVCIPREQMPDRRKQFNCIAPAPRTKPFAEWLECSHLNYCILFPQVEIFERANSVWHICHAV